MSVGFSLMKNLLTALAKIVLVPLGLTAAVSETDAAIHSNAGSRNGEDCIDNLKRRSGRYHENS